MPYGIGPRAARLGGGAGRRALFPAKKGGTGSYTGCCMRTRSLWVDRHLLDPHCGGKGRISAFSSAGYCESELGWRVCGRAASLFGCWRQPLAGATPLFAPGRAPYRIAIPITFRTQQQQVEYLVDAEHAHLLAPSTAPVAL